MLRRLESVFQDEKKIFEYKIFFEVFLRLIISHFSTRSISKLVALGLGRFSKW